MRVLLIGDDAIAHAVSEQLARNSELYALMQKFNPGIAKSTQKYYTCDFSNLEVIGSWAIKEKIDLVFVTSETAIEYGNIDALQDIGITTASPTMAAAIIGNNRAYARNIFHEHVRFPKFYSCKSIKDVKKAIKDFNKSVIKSAIRTEWQGLRFADVDSQNKGNSLKEVEQMIKRHGNVIVEEKIDGESFTLHAFCDGKNLSVMPPIRVAKHALEGDKGENTEGMGSLSTGKLLPYTTEDELETATNMLQKIVSIMRNNGADYKGVLHGSFMISHKGVKLLDLRSSFGNPEGINCLGLLRTQLVEILQSMADGNLKPPSFLDKPSVVKYLVPKNYPNSDTENRKKTKKYGNGQISLDEKLIWDNGAKNYFEYVEIKDRKMYLTDERAVAVFANGETLEEAEQRVSSAISTISGDVRWRIDIGTKHYLDRRVKRAKTMKGSFRYMQPIVKKT